MVCTATHSFAIVFCNVHVLVHSCSCCLCTAASRATLSLCFINTFLNWFFMKHGPDAWPNECTMALRVFPQIGSVVGDRIANKRASVHK